MMVYSAKGAQRSVLRESQQGAEDTTRYQDFAFGGISERLNSHLISKKLSRLALMAFSLSAFTLPLLQAQAPAPKPTDQNKQPQQSQPTQQQPTQQQPQQTPEQKKQNPFETVPESQEPATPPPGQTKPATPQRSAPSAQPATPTPGGSDLVEAIEFRGARRVTQDTLRALARNSRVGEPLDDDMIQRDFASLWNSGRFDDLKVEKIHGDKGWIIRWQVTERPVIRSITYEGNKSVSVSDILDRYKERKVGLVVESQYDPNKVQRAKNVLQELLAEHGHQYATVTVELHQVPPASLSLVFKVVEGPTVKVGKIDIENNHAFKDKQVIHAMKNLRPMGIPYSILFENLFARTYDAAKLDEDKERIRDFYQQNGYFLARVENSSVNVRTSGGTGMHIPLIYPNKPRKLADLTIAMDEGRKYSLDKVTFTGVKLFKTPNALMRPLFGMADGDTFSTEKVRKGVKNFQKLYGEFGYMNAVVEPDFEPHPDSGKLDMTLNVDEGNQFFVRRIDFSGNTTTRDRVIRRELLIDEGDLFNTRLWEISILRLNQLGYFEPLKEEEAADVKTDNKTNTVDLTLKVKERGKNAVQLNGGVSALAGSFIGFSYSTNNFLGLGETLSLSTQLGTMQRSVQFGFTEPYLFDRPIQSGFTLYYSRFDYDQARQQSIFAGFDLRSQLNQFGAQNLLNYVSNSYGATVFASYQLRRSFARVGLSYGFDHTRVKPLTNAAQNYFDYLNFQGVNGSGPNSLSGIRTSKVTPSFTYNTVDHPITPTRGLSVFASLGVAGLGGNVNTLEPSLDVKYFRHGFRKGHVIGMHLLGRFTTGYNGKTAPPFSRYYAGGENDIRGFDIWEISPIGWIPGTTPLNVLNADGTPRTQKFLGPGGVPIYTKTQMTIPIYQIVALGGDTNVIGNLEYRIPIVGPVTLAPFVDAGINRISLPSQLALNPGQVNGLNAQFPQAGYNDRVQIAPGTQKMRMSTGIELQVLLPVVNAPFRVYWAFNPMIVRENLIPPLAIDRSQMPNAATYNEAIGIYHSAIPYDERRSTFRFSVGRTF